MGKFTTFLATFVVVKSDFDKLLIVQLLGLNHIKY